MVRPGDFIENPVTGERMTWVRTSVETGGAMAEIDLELTPTAFLAAEHIHLHQEEKFEILEGRIRLQSGGSESIREPGEIVVVPAGSPHFPSLRVGIPGPLGVVAHCMFLEALGVRLAGSAIGATLRGIRRNWRRPRLALEAWKGARASKKLAKGRAAVLKRAALIGKRVAVSRNGNVVTYSNGTKRAFFSGDLQAYKAAASGAGGLAIARQGGFQASPPPLLGHWTQAVIDRWLADNPKPKRRVSHRPS
jgi:mannose-6-phosphate isomerase-like protein (cupin superfamily)